MDETLIGRTEELTTLRGLFTSRKSEFVAVYGRRRVGKTYLIRSVFENEFSFQMSGLADATLTQQLTNFYVAFQKISGKPEVLQPETWFQAFVRLTDYLESLDTPRKVIFIDELPWFDTHGSGFIQALEHFWNSWASARKDIVLVVCGSSASWMLNNLIHNKGGLHNRITKKLKINPFTLNECERFLFSKGSSLDRYQIIQLYMVLGGIPYYWDDVEPSQSAAQNIERICFTENGLLRTEFNDLYRSLFDKFEKHLLIVNALAQKGIGLTREDIIEQTQLSNGGGMTRLLNELEESGFIRKYLPFGKKTRNSLYQLVDFYTLFYLKFIQNTQVLDKNIWLNAIDSPQHRAWSGYAFEQVCLYHLSQIKQALGIAGVQTSTSSWRSRDSEQGAQIDLVIERRDQVVNLCEMKFSINPFEVDKQYAMELRNKIGVFKSETKTRKSVFMTLITTFGVKKNSHSIGLVQNEIEMEALFEK